MDLAPAAGSGSNATTAGQPLSICLVSSAMEWGGGEHMFVEMALGFLQAGHRVAAVSRPAAVLSARWPAGVRQLQLGLRSDLDLVSVVGMARLFRRHRVDAVFCNFRRDCLLAGLAALPAGPPVFWIKAVVKASRGFRDLLLYRWLLTGVVSVSEAVREGVARLGVPASLLHVIRNGVEARLPALDRAAARAAVGLEDADFAVAYTGRLAADKGADLLPEVARLLRDAGVPAKLLVAGDGPMRGVVERGCRDAGLAERVALLGFVDEPMRILLACDAAVMPSRTDSFPVAALEALAAGTPLIACGVGGLLEIVEDGDSGVLVPPDDPAALAGALARVYRDPDWAATLSARGRARAAYFSRDRMIGRYVELIRQGWRSGPAPAS